MRTRLPLIAFALAAAARPAPAAVPPVPTPDGNPITEDKRVLGKILFWDEQLSSDDSIACGTCHRPAFGGADPRSGRHTGIDKGTIDDVMGSPGIVSLGRDGHAQLHPLFGTGPQVTPRLAPSNFAGIWADELFWDGRASTLENQIRFPIEHPDEMGSTLDNAVDRFTRHDSYVRAFAQAFPDDPKITPANIARALAAYERTLG